VEASAATMRVARTSLRRALRAVLAQDERWHVCEGFNHDDAVALTDEGVESAALQLREAGVQEELKSLALGKKLQLGKKAKPWLSQNTKPERDGRFPPDVLP
jgi:hypothetical protein